MPSPKEKTLLRINAAITPPIIPPAAPSTVFLGLITGERTASDEASGKIRGSIVCPDYDKDQKEPVPPLSIIKSQK